MRALLLALALLAAGAALAQAPPAKPPPKPPPLGIRVNGGFDWQPLAPSLKATVTAERPSLSLFGIRWGPAGTLDFRTHFNDADLQLLLGVAGAINLPNTPWAVKLKLLSKTELQTGEPFTVGPDFQVSFSAQF